MFGLFTMSLVMNRLFHKRAWELSFYTGGDGASTSTSITSIDL